MHFGAGHTKHLIGNIYRVFLFQIIIKEIPNDLSIHKFTFSFDIYFTIGYPHLIAINNKCMKSMEPTFRYFMY